MHGHAHQTKAFVTVLAADISPRHIVLAATLTDHWAISPPICPCNCHGISRVSPVTALSIKSGSNQPSVTVTASNHAMPTVSLSNVPTGILSHLGQYQPRTRLD